MKTATPAETKPAKYLANMSDAIAWHHAQDKAVFVADTAGVSIDNDAEIERIEGLYLRMLNK